MRPSWSAAGGWMSAERRAAGAERRAAGAASGPLARRTLVVCLAIGACVAGFASDSPAYASSSSLRARLAWHVLAADSRHARSWLGSSAGRNALANALGVGLAALAPDASARPLVVAGGTIDGTVTSSVSKLPLAGIEVCALEPEAPLETKGPLAPEGPPFFRCATTAANGEYALAGLPPGSFLVEFAAPLESGLDYQTQFYNGQARVQNANAVALASGEVKNGIDAALLPGAEISGTVSSAVTKGALAKVLVCAFDAAIESGSCAFSGPSGAYAIRGLPSGSYSVSFVPFEEATATVSYAIQFYDGKPAEAEANGVSVLAGGAPTPNIDASLVESVPRSHSHPAVAGNAVAGQTLTAVHASWTNSPTRFLDHWLQCATSVSVSCLVIGTGESYALQSSDVGSVIRVKEWAFGAAGESEPVGSAPTAIVQAAPPLAAAPATVAPTTGVLPFTSATASAAQLRSLLEHLLTPTGRNAKIAQLLKHKGYSVSFSALNAGKLAISWYLAPKGARLVGAKPLLLAAGSVSFAAAGAAKLTIRLTANGKRVLSHASRLSLTAKGALDASGGAGVSATKSFALKR